MKMCFSAAKNCLLVYEYSKNAKGRFRSEEIKISWLFALLRFCMEKPYRKHYFLPACDFSHISMENQLFHEKYFFRVLRSWKTYLLLRKNQLFAFSFLRIPIFLIFLEIFPLFAKTRKRFVFLHEMVGNFTKIRKSATWEGANLFFLPFRTFHTCTKELEVGGSQNRHFSHFCEKVRLLAISAKNT